MLSSAKVGGESCYARNSSNRRGVSNKILLTGKLFDLLFHFLKGELCTKFFGKMPEVYNITPITEIENKLFLRQKRQANIFS